MTVVKYPRNQRPVIFGSQIQIHQTKAMKELGKNDQQIFFCYLDRSRSMLQAAVQFENHRLDCSATSLFLHAPNGGFKTLFWPSQLADDWPHVRSLYPSRGTFIGFCRIWALMQSASSSSGTQRSAKAQKFHRLWLWFTGTTWFRSHTHTHIIR